METDYHLTLLDYLNIARRRVAMIIVIFSVVFSVSLGSAIILPPVYQSSGTILIESQQISSEIISSTVTGFARERIEIIKQRVMTRDNLSGIIKKYGLFNTNNESKINSVFIDKLRSNINIEVLSSNIVVPRNRGKESIAFSIAFENGHPELAYGVTSELVTLFLDENIKSRVERATETTEFLSQEAKRLKNELEEIEGKVAEYKQQHANALPEHLNMKMGMLERTQKSLAELDREYKVTEVEISSIELELVAEQSGSGGADGTSISELEALKAEYQKATLLYKENHPTVRMLKHKIDALNKVSDMYDGKKVSKQVIVNSPFVSKLMTMINISKSKLESIEEQRIPLRKKITELEAQVFKTPQVELGLSSLLRDHGNAKDKYEEIQAKRLSAQIAENLEGENKSERFTLIDPPVYPDKPIKPNRVTLIILGFFLALGSAGGIAIFLELVNKKVRGYGELTTILGQSPLAEIPYIITADEIEHRKGVIKKVSLASSASLIVIIFIIHFGFIELDVLFSTILSRFR